MTPTPPPPDPSEREPVDNDPDAPASPPALPAPVFKRRGPGKTGRGSSTGRVGISSLIGTGGNDDVGPSTTTATSPPGPSDPSSTALKTDPVSDQSEKPNDGGTETEEGPSETLSVADLVALRSLYRKPGGIELEKLNQGEARLRRRKKKKRVSEAEMTKEQRWEEQMRRGGLVEGVAGSAGGGADEGEADAEAGEDGARRLVRRDNFQSETGTVDVDKHMMAYIESELSKRRARPSQSSDASAPLETDGPSASSASATNLLEEDLYRISEKYRALQRAARTLTGAAERTQEEEEGNVTLSTAMLQSIPEIDLGIDSRMRNIEKTEVAKRGLARSERERRERGEVEGERDEGFARARFFRPYNRTQSDQDATTRRTQPGGAGRTGANPHGAGGSNEGAGRRERREMMASDQFVLDRFKKRQRNFR